MKTKKKGNLKMKFNAKTFIIATFVVFAIIICTGGIGYNSTQNFQVIQSMGGDMYVQSQGGYYGKFFPKVWTYDKVRTIYFSSDREESKDNDGLPVRFANKGTGTVSVQVIARLFSTPETMYKLHAYARGDVGIIENIIFAKLKEIAMSVASTMSSNDAIENYAKFNEGIRSKIINNAELKEQGIFIEQFSITGISFDKLTTGQFQKQQEIELARKEAEANKIKFETERDTVKIQYEKEQAESEGKAKVVMIKETTDAEREKRLAEIAAEKQVAVAKLAAEQAKIDAEKVKEVAIVEATKNKETAKLNNEAAKLDAERIITLASAKQKELELAKGLSELDKFKMTIDKETSIGVAEAWANGISKMKLPETFMLGGSGNQGGGMNPMETFFNLMNASTAKELASKKESK